MARISSRSKGGQASLARMAIALHFLIDGVGFGVWAAFIPTMKQRLGLTDIQLSGVLLGMVGGAMIAMPLVGRIIARKGSAGILAFVGPAYGMALLLPILAPTHLTAILAAAVFGALKGALDVSVNTQAISLEEEIGCPVNASLQGLWSAGGLLSAILASMVLRQGVPPPLFSACASLVLVLTSLFSWRYLLAGSGKQSDEEEGSSPEGPPWQLIRVGILAFAALFSEGVMMDWGAVYAGTVGLAPEWLAPIAYAVFCCSMAIGRFSGDRILMRLGVSDMLKISGAAMACGLLLMVTVHHWAAIFAGLGVVGLGTANLVPIFLRAGGAAHPSNMGRGVATVSTIGYVGFLAGPPVVGGVSELLGLPAAFGVVAVFAMLIAFLSPMILSKPGKGAIPSFDKENKLGSQQLL